MAAVRLLATQQSNKDLGSSIPTHKQINKACKSKKQDPSAQKYHSS
jgi:hypothetical protein